VGRKNIKDKIINYMNKIMKILERLPCDNRIHFIIGAILTSFLLVCGVNVFFTFMILTLTAYGIELYRKMTDPEGYELYDALVVLVGGVVVILPIIIKVY